MRAAHSHETTRHPRAALGRNTRLASLLGVLGVLLSGGLVQLATAAPAAAHDDIVAAYPEAGSTVGIVPEEIALTFSGEILTDTSAVVIEVIAPDGQNVAADPPLIDGTTVTQTLAPEQGPGVFTVRWRVVSSDGHPISDEYTYTIEAPTVPTSTPTPEGTAEQTPEPSPTSTDATGNAGHGEPSGGGALLPVLAIVSGVIVIGGTLVVVLLVGRERRRRDRAAASAGATETEEGADQS